MHGPKGCYTKWGRSCSSCLNHVSREFLSGVTPNVVEGTHAPSGSVFLATQTPHLWAGAGPKEGTSRTLKSFEPRMRDLSHLV